ncbi:hypothetical protein Tco_1282660, partial [Tanacetum coccineum]
ADESITKQKALELEIERPLREVVNQDIMSIVQNPSVVDTSNLQTELEPKLRAQLFDKVSDQKDTTRGTSANTKFAKQSILGKPPSSKPKLYVVTPLPKSTVFPKVGGTNALSNQVTSNSVPSSQESKVMKNDNVISSGIFRINLFKASREKSTVSSLLEEKKKLKSDFKIREDELLDKQIQLENNIKELDNILVKMAQQKQQSLYNGKVLLENHDPPVVYDSEKTLELAQESRLKMKQLNKEIKLANYTKINHLSGVYVSQTAKSREELYFSNTSKTVNVSKSISIPNKEFSDDTTPSVARKFLNEADESIAKQKALELEIERPLREVVNQDIMFIVQNPSVVDTSNLQTELERTKERFEICMIKKENEYAKLWNDWYKKCEECKYDKISYDKTYNDMQQKIERLQAQLGDQKGKSKDTPCVSDQKDTTRGTSANTKFAKQSILGKPPSSKPKLINPFKASRVDNCMPNKHVKTSVRTKPITVSQPRVITKNDVNSKTNGFSPKDVKSTTRTRRPQPRNNPKNDKVPFKSKSSCLSNKLEKIEENHRSLQSSNYPDHTSSECNNIKLAIRNEKSEVICATCKQCLITANHDECVLQYVNGMKSRKKNQSANVSKSANQKKHKPRVWKPKKVGSKERLASPKPSTPRSCLRWSPTGRMFDLKGKIIATSESECQSDCFKGDNACTSNPQEPISKRFPNSTFSMTGGQNWFDTLLIPLLSEYKPKDKEDHGDNECDT